MTNANKKLVIDLVSEMGRRAKLASTNTIDSFAVQVLVLNRMREEGRVAAAEMDTMSVLSSPE